MGTLQRAPTEICSLCIDMVNALQNIEKVSWVLSVFMVLGAEDIKELIKNSPTHKEYPKAGALVLLDRKVVEVYPDRRTSSSGLLVVKIFDDRGKGEYGDIKERYNNEKEEFHIMRAITHTRDGVEIEVEEKAITDLSAPEVLEAAAYTNARVKVVSFPGLETDAVIEYQYKIVPIEKRKSWWAKFFKKEEREYFFGQVIFGAEEPILKKEFILMLPKSIGFKYIVRNHQIEPNVEYSDNKIIYTWELNNIPAIVSEPNMPPNEEIAPCLIYSSFDSWDELAKWLCDKFYSAIRAADKEMKEKMHELTANKGDEEIIRDCFLYVTTEIRNVELPVGLAGYAPNKAKDIYSHKYGDPRDKAVLLCSLLKEARCARGTSASGGIEAFPVFVNTNHVSIVKEVPSPSMFNHIIVAIRGDHGYFLMDPQATNSTFGYLPHEEQGVEGFILFERGFAFKTTLTMPREANLSSSTLKLSISEEGDLRGEIFTELKGSYETKARQRLKDMTQKEEKMWIQEVLSRIAPNAKLLSYSFSNLKDLTEPVELRASFEADEFASVSDSVIQFFLPRCPFDFANPSHYVSLSERKYLLLTHPSRVLQYHVELEIPEGFRVDYLPQGLMCENDFAKASISTDTLDGEIKYASELIFKHPNIEPKEYADFKSVVAEFLKPKSRMIILKGG